MIHFLNRYKNLKNVIPSNKCEFNLFQFKNFICKSPARSLIFLISNKQLKHNKKFEISEKFRKRNGLEINYYGMYFFLVKNLNTRQS